MVRLLFDGITVVGSFDGKRELQCRYDGTIHVCERRVTLFPLGFFFVQSKLKRLITQDGRN